MQDFCRPNTNAFQTYIDYMDREETHRSSVYKFFSLFHEYMENPLKSTGLFTADKDSLTKDEKTALKDIFEVAQKNESIMWQTVISFDNRWLGKNGLYDSKTMYLDEDRLKGILRNAMDSMLKKEGLENAVWSAAFHYNTDNLHVHFAIIEPEPMRQKIMYKGEMEYKGKLKQSSLEACKSKVVNEILQTKEMNIMINQVIRKNLVASLKEKMIANDPEIRESFLKLYEETQEIPKNMMKYNMNVMKKHHVQIDKISDLYIQKYHAQEINELKEKVRWVSDLYAEAYGQTKRSFEENVFKDLYTRMGNAVLTQVRTFDKNMDQMLEKEMQERNADEETPKKNHEKMEFEDLGESVEQLEPFDLKLSEKPKHMNEELLKELNAWESWEKQTRQNGKKNGEEELQKKYEDWMEQFRELRTDVNLKEKAVEEIKGEIDRACQEKNPFILSMKADFLMRGNLYEANLEQAESCYKEVLQIFLRDEENLSAGFDGNSKFNLQKYVEYRIGKQYDRGLGVDADAVKALEWYLESDESYARFSVGNLYCEGKGEIEKDYVTAFRYFQDLTEIPYANLKLAEMHKNGWGCEKSEALTEQYYTSAFAQLMKLVHDEKQLDGMAEYQIGKMYYHGLGCSQDIEEAEKYLLLAADKKNLYAQYLLSDIYIQKGDQEHIQEAIKMLTELAEKTTMNNAPYLLGKIYLDQESGVYDPEKGAAYLERAVELGNDFAKYHVAVKYLDKESGIYQPEKGMQYIQGLAEEGNMYAQTKLGCEYLKGKHVKRNVEEAKSWFEKAADQGDDFAKKLYENVSAEFPVKYSDNKVVTRNARKDYLGKALCGLQRSFEQEHRKTMQILYQYEMEQEWELEKEMMTL